MGISGGTRPRQIVYATDLAGQILSRGEYDTNYSQNDPHSRSWMFGGRAMGQVGNDGVGGVAGGNVDYATSIAERTATPGTGAFRNGGTSASLFADFDAHYSALNGQGAGGGGGSSYTVASGDTLQGIAQAVWGDANLWYKLAEANGLAGGTSLSAGQSLIIPGGVMGTHHNAATFKPYDPADAIGNTSPNTPKPPKQGKNCGAFGQILMVAIAVAVAVIAPIGGGTVWAAMGNAALGSAVSQGVGLATGIQDRFNFKGFALSVISAGATKGIVGDWSPLGNAADGTLKAAGNAAIGGMAASAITQGVGVATGLQSKFDFAGVAAAGVGGGVGSFIGGQLGGKFSASIGQFGRDLAANTAGGIANAATRSAIEGNSFGDNLIAALPDIIGQTIGNMVAGGVAGRGRGGNTGAGTSTEQPVAGEGGDEIIVTGNYNLSGLGGSSNMSTIAVAGAFEGSVGGGLNVASTFANDGPLDPRQAIMSWDPMYEEIVVTAPMQVRNSVASWFRTDAGNAVASNGGVQHWGGPKLGPWASVKRMGGAAVGGVVDIGMGIMGSAQLLWNLGSFDRATAQAARGQLAALPQATFGALVGATDQLVVYDNPLPGIRIGTSMAVGGAAGRLVSARAGSTVAAETAAVGGGGATGRQVLYHYTNEAGAAGIVDGASLNPSLWRVGTKDVRYGNGQYVSDIVPGTRTLPELSYDFLRNPFQGNRFTHYVEIDATGLGAVQGRAGVYVIPNETPLDLTGRLVSSGRVPRK